MESLWMFSLGVLAQGEAEFDFRHPVMVAYTVVFVFIVAYLVASYLKNSKLQEEVGFLKRRVEELESKAS